MTAIETARDLGITITRATPGSDMFECWADRVMQCWAYLAEGEIGGYFTMRDEAERYVV